MSEDNIAIGDDSEQPEVPRQIRLRRKKRAKKQGRGKETQIYAGMLINEGSLTFSSNSSELCFSDMGTDMGMLTLDGSGTLDLPWN